MTSGFSPGLAIALMLVCLAIGFLIGTRGRQIVQSLKATGQAVRSLTLRIPAAAAIAGEATAAGDDDNDKEEEEEGETDTTIADFIMPTDADASLADHPDVHLSPVILYKIKRAKEELRIAQRRAALLAEGFDESEVDERMQLEQVSGGGGGGRANPLALLISVGARVEPSAGGDSAEAVKLQERRRMQRNVDQYLMRAEGVEKFRNEDGKPPQGRVQTAHEVARMTALTPVGGETRAREVANVPRAKEARNLFRKWHEVNQKTKARQAGPARDRKSVV